MANLAFTIEQIDLRAITPIGRRKIISNPVETSRSEYERAAAKPYLPVQIKLLILLLVVHAEDDSVSAEGAKATGSLRDRLLTGK